MGKSLALGHVTFLLRNMNFYFGHDWHFYFSKCVSNCGSNLMLNLILVLNDSIRKNTTLDNGLNHLVYYTSSKSSTRHPIEILLDI